MFALGGGDERVLVRRGDGLVRKGVSPPPTFVKIDVEGAEAGVLRGLIDVLKPAARLFVAMHSHAVYHECVELMRGAGFAVYPSTEVERAAQAASWSGDPDVFFVGPAWRGTDQDLRMLRAAGY
jgi:hypothetical protein